MSGVKFVTIGGCKYPLSFSFGAVKRLAGKYGGINQMSEAMGNIGNDDMASLDVLTDVLEVLIYQGCEYMNVIEKGLPPEKGAKTNEKGEYIPASKNEIELLMSLDEMTKAAEVIGWMVTGEVGKNSEAAQAEAAE